MAAAEEGEEEEEEEEEDDEGEKISRPTWAVVVKRGGGTVMARERGK